MQPLVNPKIQPEFDRYAAGYTELLADPVRDAFAASDFFHRRKLILLREFLRRRKLDPAGICWVDVGCGKGELLQMGADSFARVMGCDVSPAMLARCDRIEVRRQDPPATLPFPDRVAGLVTAVCVYHHVPLAERPAITRELARILKPGGIACVIEHNPFNPVTRRIVKRCPVDVDARLLRPSETCRLMQAHGLSVLAVDHFLFLPERLFGKFGHLESALRRLPLGGQYAVFARSSGTLR